MPGPRTRAELLAQVTTSFANLQAELDELGPRGGNLPCVDEWTVKDLLAVRLWWTEHVLQWIEAGRRGEQPTTPAPGYRWSQTPRLNADVVRSMRRSSYRSIRERLSSGFVQVLLTIEALDDHELLEPAVFAWAGKYPLARWLSINTARQYTTARTFVRRARRQAESTKHP